MKILWNFSRRNEKKKEEKEKFEFMYGKEGNNVIRLK